MLYKNMQIICNIKIQTFLVVFLADFFTQVFFTSLNSNAIVKRYWAFISFFHIKHKWCDLMYLLKSRSKETYKFMYILRMLDTQCRNRGSKLILDLLKKKLLVKTLTQKFPNITSYLCAFIQQFYLSFELLYGLHKWWIWMIDYYLNLGLILHNLFTLCFLCNGIRWPLFTYLHHNSQS